MMFIAYVFVSILLISLTGDNKVGRALLAIFSVIIWGFYIYWTLN